MNTDELRAADIETAVRIARDNLEMRCPHSSPAICRALLLLNEQNAALREEIDVLTGQHERDERENAELRRVLGDALRRAEMYEMWHDEARRLLAGEVQDADVSPPVKLRPGTATIHAHDCPCWTCEGGA